MDLPDVHDDEAGSVQMLLPYGFLQVQGRIARGFFAQVEGSPLCGDEEAGIKIVEGFQGFSDVNMRIVHEPSGMVSGGGDECVVDVGKQAPEFTVTDEISAVCTIIDGSSGSDDHKTCPQCFIDGLADAPGPVLGGKTGEGRAVAGIHLIPPVHFHNGSLVKGGDIFPEPPGNDDPRRFGQ